MEAYIYYKQNIESIVDDIERLVRADSPSSNKELADHCKEILQSMFKSNFNRNHRKS